MLRSLSTTARYVVWPFSSAVITVPGTGCGEAYATGCDEVAGPRGLPKGASPSIALSGSINARRSAAYSFDNISRIGMFGVNFGSATYLLRSANASFNDSVTACRYGALLWRM